MAKVGIKGLSVTRIMPAQVFFASGSTVNYFDKPHKTVHA